MKKLLYPVCLIAGHKINRNESIIATGSDHQWLCKCHRCGRYVAHSFRGSIAITQGEAMRIKGELDDLKKMIKEIEA